MKLILHDDYIEIRAERNALGEDDVCEKAYVEKLGLRRGGDTLLLRRAFYGGFSLSLITEPPQKPGEL